MFFYVKAPSPSLWVVCQKTKSYTTSILSTHTHVYSKINCANAVELLCFFFACEPIRCGFNTFRHRCSSILTPVQRQWPLHWSQLLHCFTSKVFLSVPFTFVRPFLPFIMSLHCSLPMKNTFASLSSSDLVV